MRKPKPRSSFGPSYALVVDGETEVWYFQMLKQFEDKKGQFRINIKPEIPQKKTLEGQFELVKELAGSEYKRVFWIVDLDTIQKESREVKRGERAATKKQSVSSKENTTIFTPDYGLTWNMQS
jgi:hypothetical protein